MTTQISGSAKEKAFDKVVREQFDAFEREERRLRMEERLERATKLRLPIAVQRDQTRPDSLLEPA
jgi:hypothetical protein